MYVCACVFKRALTCVRTQRVRCGGWVCICMCMCVCVCVYVCVYVCVCVCVCSNKRSLVYEQKGCDVGAVCVQGCLQGSSYISPEFVQTHSSLRKATQGAHAEDKSRLLCVRVCACCVCVRVFEGRGGTCICVFACVEGVCVSVCACCACVYKCVCLCSSGVYVSVCVCVCAISQCT